MADSQNIPPEVLEELCAVAADCPADERCALIQSRCDGNEPLRDAVLDFLRWADAADANSFLGDADRILAPGVAGALKAAGQPADAARRYEALEEIAVGGMGIVLRAFDTVLSRDVALKVIRADIPREEIQARFETETRITARLQHPGVPPVYDRGRLEDGRPFFVMKFVQGKTLGQQLLERQSPQQDLPRFLAVFDQACQTVAYAHARSVIHRDLKPANIMIGAFGEVHVMDWGLAKVLDDNLAAPLTNEVPTTSAPKPLPKTRSTANGDDANTSAGDILGTPSYMSPEQASGDTSQVDRRADVYALGAILCEILIGKPPSRTDGKENALPGSSRGLHDLLGELERCGAEQELVTIVKQCLNVDVDRRLRDAGIVVRLFSSYLQARQSRLREVQLSAARAEAVATEERKRHRLTKALAVSILLSVVLGVWGWGWLQQREALRRKVATARFYESLSEARTHEGLANSSNPDARLRELEIAINLADQAVRMADQTSIDEGHSSEANRLLGGLQKQAAIVEQSVADRDFQETLGLIYMSQADGGEDFSISEDDLHFDQASAGTLYEAAFRKAGIDVLSLEPRDAANRIRQSAIREHLIAALDDWARSIHVFTLDELQNDTERAEWNAVCEVARQSLEAEPTDSVRWLHLAPALVLAGRHDAYREHCRNMARQFAGTSDLGVAERTCKACLLLPNAIDVAELPYETLEERLGNETTSRDFLPWGWVTRALVAYRRGDSETAVRCVQESLRHKAFASCFALNLAVRAMAHHDLHQADQARHDLEQATQIIDRADSQIRTRADHDILVAQILVREARALIHGNRAPTRLARQKQAPARDAVSSPEEIEKQKLLATADAADESPWRKALRAALNRADTKALKLLATADEASDQSPALTAWLGAALRAAGQNNLSVDVLQKAQQQHPEDFWLNFELCKSCQSKGDSKQSLGYARAALAIRPQSLVAAWEVADALAAAGLSQESSDLYQRLLQRFSSDDPGRLRQLGHHLANGGKCDLAVVAYHKAIELDPQHAVTHYQLGRALEQGGQLQESAAAFRRAIELDPHDALLHKRLGLVLAKQGKLEEALVAWHKAIELNPKSADDHKNIGVALMRQGKLEEGIASCQHAIALDPLNASLRHGLAWELVRRHAETRIDRARLSVELAQRACELFSHNHAYWNTLGIAHYRLGQWSPALEAFQKAATLGNRGPVNYLFLAMTHWQLGNREEARRWYNKAIALSLKHSSDAMLKEWCAEAAELLDENVTPKQTRADQRRASDLRATADVKTIGKTAIEHSFRSYARQSVVLSRGS